MREGLTLLPITYTTVTRDEVWAVVRRTYEARRREPRQ
jgi:hypothetical protein